MALLSDETRSGDLCEQLQRRLLKAAQNEAKAEALAALFEESSALDGAPLCSLLEGRKPLFSKRSPLPQCLRRQTEVQRLRLRLFVEALCGVAVADFEEETSHQRACQEGAEETGGRNLGVLDSSWWSQLSEVCFEKELPRERRRLVCLAAATLVRIAEDLATKARVVVFVAKILKRRLREAVGGKGDRAAPSLLASLLVLLSRSRGEASFKKTGAVETLPSLLRSRAVLRELASTALLCQSLETRLERRETETRQRERLAGHVSHAMRCVLSALWFLIGKFKRGASPASSLKTAARRRRFAREAVLSVPFERLFALAASQRREEALFLFDGNCSAQQRGRHDVWMSLTSRLDSDRRRQSQANSSTNSAASVESEASETAPTESLFALAQEAAHALFRVRVAQLGGFEERRLRAQFFFVGTGGCRAEWRTSLPRLPQRRLLPNARQRRRPPAFPGAVAWLCSEVKKKLLAVRRAQAACWKATGEDSHPIAEETLAKLKTLCAALSLASEFVGGVQLGSAIDALFEGSCWTPLLQMATSTVVDLAAKASECQGQASVRLCTALVKREEKKKETIRTPPCVGGLGKGSDSLCKSCVFLLGGIALTLHLVALFSELLHQAARGAAAAMTLNSLLKAVALRTPCKEPHFSECRHFHCAVLKLSRLFLEGGEVVNSLNRFSRICNAYARAAAKEKCVSDRGGVWLLSRSRFLFVSFLRSLLASLAERLQRPGVASPSAQGKLCVQTKALRPFCGAAGDLRSRFGHLPPPAFWMDLPFEAEVQGRLWGVFFWIAKFFEPSEGFFLPLLFRWHLASRDEATASHSEVALESAFCEILLEAETAFLCLLPTSGSLDLQWLPDLLAVLESLHLAALVSCLCQSSTAVASQCTDSWSEGGLSALCRRHALLLLLVSSRQTWSPARCVSAASLATFLGSVFFADDLSVSTREAEEFVLRFSAASHRGKGGGSGGEEEAADKTFEENGELSAEFGDEEELRSRGSGRRSCTSEGSLSSRSCSSASLFDCESRRALSSSPVFSKRRIEIPPLDLQSLPPPASYRDLRPAAEDRTPMESLSFEDKKETDSQRSPVDSCLNRGVSRGEEETGGTQAARRTSSSQVVFVSSRSAPLPKAEAEALDRDAFASETRESQSARLSKKKSFQTSDPKLQLLASASRRSQMQYRIRSAFRSSGSKERPWSSLSSVVGEKLNSLKGFFRQLGRSRSDGASVRRPPSEESEWRVSSSRKTAASRRRCLKGRGRSPPSDSEREEAQKSSSTPKLLTTPATPGDLEEKARFCSSQPLSSQDARVSLSVAAAKTPRLAKFELSLAQPQQKQNQKQHQARASPSGGGAPSLQLPSQMSPDVPIAPSEENSSAKSECLSPPEASLTPQPTTASSSKAAPTWAETPALTRQPTVPRLNLALLASQQPQKNQARAPATSAKQRQLDKNLWGKSAVVRLPEAEAPADANGSASRLKRDSPLRVECRVLERPLTTETENVNSEKQRTDSSPVDALPLCVRKALCFCQALRGAWEEERPPGVGCIDTAPPTGRHKGCTWRVPEFSVEEAALGIPNARKRRVCRGDWVLRAIMAVEIMHLLSRALDWLSISAEESVGEAAIDAFAEKGDCENDERRREFLKSLGMEMAVTEAPAATAEVFDFSEEGSETSERRREFEQSFSRAAAEALLPVLQRELSEHRFADRQERRFLWRVVSLAQLSLLPGGKRLLKLCCSALFASTLFRRERRLSFGAYGCVWKAVSPATAEGVAVKEVMAPVDEKAWAVLSSVSEEARALSRFRLSLPLVAEVFDFGLEADRAGACFTYCICQRLYGPSLCLWRKKWIASLDEAAARISLSLSLSSNVEEERGVAVRRRNLLQLAALPVLLGVFGQILAAVAAIHASGFAHFDVKSANVLLDRTILLPLPRQELLLGDTSSSAELAADAEAPELSASLLLMPSIALCDFGEARRLDKDGVTKSQCSRARARPIGTEVNSSPEQLDVLFVKTELEASLHSSSGEGGLVFGGEKKGEELFSFSSSSRGASRVVGAASDVWSLGCLFFELLTGRPLFASDPFFFAKLQGRRPLIGEAQRAQLEDCPELLAFLEKMLKLQPETRPTAAALLNDFSPLYTRVMQRLAGEAEVPWQQLLKTACSEAVLSFSLSTEEEASEDSGTGNGAQLWVQPASPWLCFLPLLTHRSQGNASAGERSARQDCEASGLRGGVRLQRGQREFSRVFSGASSKGDKKETRRKTQAAVRRKTPRRVRREFVQVLSDVFLCSTASQPKQLEQQEEDAFGEESFEALSFPCVVDLRRADKEDGLSAADLFGATSLLSFRPSPCAGLCQGCERSGVCEKRQVHAFAEWMPLYFDFLRAAAVRRSRVVFWVESYLKGNGERRGASTREALLEGVAAGAVLSLLVEGLETDVLRAAGFLSCSALIPCRVDGAMAELLKKFVACRREAVWIPRQKALFQKTFSFADSSSSSATEAKRSSSLAATPSRVCCLCGACTWLLPRELLLRRRLTLSDKGPEASSSAKDFAGRETLELSEVECSCASSQKASCGEPCGSAAILGEPCALYVHHLQKAFGLHVQRLSWLCISREEAAVREASTWSSSRCRDESKELLRLLLSDAFAERGLHDASDVNFLRLSRGAELNAREFEAENVGRRGRRARLWQTFRCAVCGLLTHALKKGGRSCVAVFSTVDAAAAPPESLEKRGQVFKESDDFSSSEESEACAVRAEEDRRFDVATGRVFSNFSAVAPLARSSSREKEEEQEQEQEQEQGPAAPPEAYRLAHVPPLATTSLASLALPKLSPIF